MWEVGVLKNLCPISNYSLIAAFPVEVCLGSVFSYRYFEFGDIRNINIQELNLKSREVNTIELKPNDPLYLMTPNNLKDHENEATNVEHQKAFSSNIEYEDRDGNIAKSKVVFKMSIAKPEIQALLGGSATGQHYENNTGISFIRAGREIDFDTFGFLSNSEPRHRWWGHR